MRPRTEPSPVIPRRALDRWWQSQGIVVQDGVMALVLTTLALIPSFEGAGVDLAEMPEHQPVDAVGWALIVTQSLPLVLRRWRPLLCLAIIAPALAAHQALGYPLTMAGLGLYVATYTAGVHLDRFRRGTVVAGAAAYTVLAVVLLARGSQEQPFGFVTFFLVLLAFAGAGTWVRSWRSGEVKRQHYEAHLAIAEERARIARELHDVVTHHVTAMVVQADAAQYLVDQPEQVTTGLSAVSDTGRRALTELRHLLDVLDASEDTATVAGRAPAVGLITDLVEETRRAGQTVEMRQEGARPEMDSGVELAVYRVVQEGLTNAAKHARSCPTTVSVRYASDEIGVEVSTGGPVLADEPKPGRGLTGLRERVGLLGGEVWSGGRPEGGFTVRARIPSRGVG